MTDGILTSVKDLIGGLKEEYTYYDDQIIMHINSAFRTLNQLGVGPKTPFRISSKAETWDDFMSDGFLDDIKDYVALKVKLVFDPPANSFLVDAVNSQIKELEWRLNVAVDPGEVDDE